MKKLLSIGLLFGAFLFFSPQASAQTDEQKVIWENAQEQTAVIAEKIDLTDNQKAYVTRHLYNYKARMDALASDSAYQPFESQSEIKNLFDKEMQEALNPEQYNQFKGLEAEILK